MEQFWNIALWNLVVVAVMMIAGWLVSLWVKNVTFVDTLWGLGFVIIAWMTFFKADGYWLRQLLIASLTTAWGVRLSIHLAWRNWGHGEDPRYAAWREQAGDTFWLVSLYKVFLIQAAFMWVIALTVQVGQISPTPAYLTPLDFFGTLVWGIGFWFEAVADFQLAQFKADAANKGKVMRQGLWAYSRHPNYFGEFLSWWGLYLIALSAVGSWWTVISPILITLVLLKMTGVTLMEKTIVDTRPGYRDYIRRTNAFFPWLPRKDAS